VTNVVFGTTHGLTLGQGGRAALRGAAGVLLAAAFMGGCSEDSNGIHDLASLADRIGCSGSYEAVTTNALGAEAMGKCTFRGYELSLVTFADNGARNGYVCSTCGFDVDTDTGAVEMVARRFGGFLVVGDRYIVRVPNAAAERAVRDALG
jgi:hypothetical protein